LIVEMVDSVCIDEHAIGVVHEALRRTVVDLRAKRTGIVAR